MNKKLGLGGFILIMLIGLYYINKQSQLSYTSNSTNLFSSRVNSILVVGLNGLG